MNTNIYARKENQNNKKTLFLSNENSVATEIGSIYQMIYLHSEANQILHNIAVLFK